MNEIENKPTGDGQAKPTGAWALVKNVLHELFDLENDKENERASIQTLSEGVDFHGANMWVLIFAILIASLGLNVNSTAVIIGAMLISPLMGPIVGFGLGLGISDLGLVKRATRNLAVMTIISLMTATIYFLVSPLSQAQSELLARTEPTIYDVLIALVGGAAGALANSTRSKGNVLPGVAIATALMPPLCTAGYGLSQGNWSFFGGAMYLYLINSIFIGLATFAMVRILKFPRKEEANPQQTKRARQWMTAIAIGVCAPSIYSGYGMIRDTITEEGAHRFVQEQLNTPSNQVVRESLTKNPEPTLEVVLLGKELSDQYLDSIKALMPSYNLSGVTLVVRQGFGSSMVEGADMDYLRETVLQDLYRNSDAVIKDQARQIDSLELLLYNRTQLARITSDVNKEAKSLFPKVHSILFAPVETGRYAEGEGEVIAIVEVVGRLSGDEEKRFAGWLVERLKVGKVSLILREPRPQSKSQTQS